MNTQTPLLSLALLCTTVSPGMATEQAQTLQVTEQTRNQAQLLVQAGLGSPEALRLAIALEEARVPQTDTLRIQEMLRQAIQEGLPGQPLVDKLHEGLVKGVPAQELIRAAERVRSRYAFGYRNASRLAGSPEAAGTGRVIAEALSAGLAEGDAERILDRLRLRERDQQQLLAKECFLTARTMAQLRLGSSAIADTLGTALQHAFQARSMAQLRHMFMEQAKLSDPALVASRFMLRIRSGQPLDAPSSDATQGLDRGSQPGGSPSGGSNGKGDPGGRGKGPGQ